MSNYLDKLDMLLEADADQDLNMQQANIADNGDDLNDPNAEPQPGGDQMDQSQDPNAGLDMNSYDASAAEDMSYMDPVSSKSNDVLDDKIEDKKIFRLYNLYTDLLRYEKEFDGSLDIINSDMLEPAEYESFKKIRNKVNNEIAKIETYLRHSYGHDKYEKTLYLYILLRTEFLSLVKSVRSTLKLDDIDEKNARNDK